MKSLFTPLFLLLSLLTFTPLNAQWEDAPDPPGGYYMAMAGDSNQAWTFVHKVGFQTTTDQGSSWQLTFSAPASMYIQSMRRMSNGDLLALQSPVGGPVTPIVVMQSTDNGYTWEYDTLCADCTFVGSHLNFEERNGHWLVFASAGSLYQSSDQGQTWSLLTPSYPPNFTARYWQVCHDGIIVGVLYDPTQVPQNAFPKTYLTSRDGGDSWNIVTPPIHQSYCTFLDSFAAISVYHDTIFHSTDGGLTFNAGLLLPPAQNGHAITLGMGGRVYVAIDDGYNFYDYMVSQDGGATWQTYDNVPFISHFINLGNDRFLACDYSSVKYVDFGTGFIENRSGEVKKNSISSMQTVGNTIYATTRSGYFRTHDSGQHWEELGNDFEVWGNDYPERDIEVRGDTIVTITYNKIFISFDDGQTWIKRFMPAVYWGAGMGFSNNIISIVVNSQVMLSDDFGLTWSYANFPNPPLNNYWQELLLFNMGDTLCAATLDWDLGYAFYISTNGGLNWQARMQPNQHQLIWDDAAMNNYDILATSGGNIYLLNDSLRVSSDGGQTWHGIIALSDYQYDAFYNPMSFVANDSFLAIAASNGSILASMDAGQNWYILAQNTPGFSGYEYSLAFLGDTLYAGFDTGYESVLPSGGLLKFSGDYTPISGTVYEDNNGNGSHDAGESPLSFAVVRLADSDYYGISNSDGYYLMMAPNQPDTLTVAPPPHTLSILPAQYYVNGPETGRDFGVRIEHTPDLSVDLTFHTPFGYNRSSIFQITSINLDTIPINATVMLVMDSILEPGAWFNPPPFATNGDTLWWHLPSVVHPGQALVVGMLFMPVDTNFAIGDTLWCAATIYPIIGDAVPSDNYSAWRAPIMGAYDPNDKLCDHNETITPDQLANGDELLYTVRFQNTGNYPAEFVHILDTIDTNLDLSTLRIVSSSHPVSLSIHNPRVLDFYFENIQLPPDDTDEPGSHGFVRYAIKPVAGLSVNDSLKNTAHIYFDYNPDIVTNTTRTVVTLPVGTWHSTQEASMALQVYPNPTSGNFTVAFDQPLGNAAQLSLFNSVGQRCGIYSVSAESTVVEINGKGLVNGLYWVVLEMGDGNRVAVKLVVLK